MVRYAFVKLGMTSMFSENGFQHGVTVLKLQPGRVIRHEKLVDGRTTVVVEYDVGRKAKVTRGWVCSKPEDFPVGSEIRPALNAGTDVAVSGRSKGKGFQDVITRHHFSGGPGAHGSRFHRCPGSIGMRTEPGRVIKGQKLPGHHGHVQVTQRASTVMYWSAEEALLAVRGSVPGSRGGIVFV